jgi:hypothetical protein
LQAGGHRFDPGTLHRLKSEKLAISGVFSQVPVHVTNPLSSAQNGYWTAVTGARLARTNARASPLQSAQVDWRISYVDIRSREPTGRRAKRLSKSQESAATHGIMELTKIRQLIRDQQMLLLVGAGLSARVGYPTYDGYAAQLLEDFGVTVSADIRGDASAVAETVKSYLSQNGRLPEFHARDAAAAATASAPLVVEVNAGDDLYSNDRRGREVDHKTERRPPARVGNELSAMLPEVLDAVTSETNDEQPWCACDRRGGNDDEHAGNAALDGEDLTTPIGDREAYVDERDPY